MKESGQTSIEYIFLLIVVVAIMASLMGSVRNFLISQSGECNPGDEALVCRLQNVFNSESDFKYFRLIRAK